MYDGANIVSPLLNYIYLPAKLSAGPLSWLDKSDGLNNDLKAVATE